MVNDVKQTFINRINKDNIILYNIRGAIKISENLNIFLPSLTQHFTQLPISTYQDVKILMFSIKCCI